MRSLLIFLAALAISGCSTESNFNATVDAITRYKDFATPQTQLEARKAFDEAARNGAPKIVVDYYYAVDQAVRVGGKENIERARVCEAEINRGEAKGECRRLTVEWQKRIQDWKPDK